MPIFTMLAAAGALCIANVYDGDSIRLCDDERIRIANIDAPEIRGSSRCQRRDNGWCDYELAICSRDALHDFLADGEVSITRLGQDRDGRMLARVTVNGRDAGALLIELGKARRWRG